VNADFAIIEIPVVQANNVILLKSSVSLIIGRSGFGRVGNWKALVVAHCMAQTSIGHASFNVNTQFRIYTSIV
jgi:hypothetical protein